MQITYFQIGVCQNLTQIIFKIKKGLIHLIDTVIQDSQWALG